ncbi:hypothetical protein [Burkholderia pseudomallei]|uniref:hypothetical protein n=1 Tax=Burkholderia pseudomallei TaxID=28450 RepID=UPI001F50788D|nr:hypothetical protein [Burkholderia pseudomallei]
MSELKGSREAASHGKNHEKAENMSWYCEAERELLHIRRAIGLLEQAQHTFINKSSVNDPAYWRVKLSKLRTQCMRNKVLEIQVDELLTRLALIQDPHCRK